MNLSFLRRLEEKLSTGNRRSIHLNALPGRALNRLDVHDTHLLEEALPQQFLKKLLTKAKFSFVFSHQYSRQTLHALPEGELQALLNVQRRLDALYYDNRDNFLEHGVTPFGFGYPLLLLRDLKDPKKFIKAPLLIWNLDLEKSDTSVGKWVVKREEDYPIYLNQVLISYLQQYEQINLRRLAAHYLEDDIIEAEELLEIVNELLGALHADADHHQALLMQCPGANTLKHIPLDQPRVYWSGVFGLYRTQKQAIIKDIQGLIKQEETRLEQEKMNAYFEEVYRISPLDTLPMPDLSPAEIYQKHHFSGVSTDPSQQLILQQLKRYPHQIIQGPPGTGKSQSLTALITNALENGAKCLVVCEKRTALEVVNENLEQLGLGELTMIVENISKDRKKVVHSVRNRVDNPSNLAVFDPTNYTVLLKQVRAAQKEVNEEQAFLLQKRLAAYNWTDLVGVYLDREGQQSKAILDDLVDLTSYAGTWEEYVHLKEVIEKGRSLYEGVGTLAHPLVQLHPQWFKQYTLGNSQQKVVKLTKQWLDQTQILLLKVKALQQKYHLALQQHYQSVFTRLSEKCQSLQAAIKDQLDIHQQAFNKRNGWWARWVKVASFMSEKNQWILDTQAILIQDYEQLQALHSPYQYLSHSFLDLSDQKTTFSDIYNNLHQFEEQLQSWYGGTENLVNAQVYQLEEQQIYMWVKEEIEPELEAVKKEYVAYEMELRKIELLAHPPLKYAVFVREELENLERVQAQLKSIRDAMPDFREVYHWQHFFLGLEAKEQVLLTSLIEKNPKKWVIAFESLYMNHLLNRSESTHTPHHDQSIQFLRSHTPLLQQQQSLKIKHLWQEKQQKSIASFNLRESAKEESLTRRQINNKIRQLYNKRGAKGQRRHSLRKIVQTDFQLFSDFFPVLLVNPSVCSSLIPLEKDLFDLVIFDEASQLRLEDTFCALIRGKHKIVSGDRHQMPPSNYFVGKEILQLPTTNQEEDEENKGLQEEDLATARSLLQYAEESGFHYSFLDFHYRSRHPYLIDFSNAAFYGSRLCPMPAQADYIPIKLLEVDGVYEKNINNTEVEKLVYILLNDIQPLPHQNLLPSVGIATFNMSQRNQILQRIQELKLESEVYANRLHALEARGLFVKNLENIQGDERDVILISTTFGPNSEGKFRQHFGPLNQEKGYQLLNVIITRAKYQVQIITSIPSSYYLQYPSLLAEKGISGRACLYSYIMYAKAIHGQKEDMRVAILNQLRLYCPEQNLALSQTDPDAYYAPFTHYLIRQLSEHIDPKRLHPHVQRGGFLIELVIDPVQEEQAPIAIEIDGMSQSQLPDSVYWKEIVYHQEQVERMGYRFIRIFSQNWWVEEEKALLELVGAILQ